MWIDTRNRFIISNYYNQLFFNINIQLFYHHSFLHLEKTFSLVHISILKLNLSHRIQIFRKFVTSICVSFININGRNIGIIHERRSLLRHFFRTSSINCNSMKNQYTNRKCGESATSLNIENRAFVLFDRNLDANSREFSQFLAHFFLLEIVEIIENLLLYSCRASVAFYLVFIFSSVQKEIEKIRKCLQQSRNKEGLNI